MKMFKKKAILMLIIMTFEVELDFITACWAFNILSFNSQTLKVLDWHSWRKQ